MNELLTNSRIEKLKNRLRPKYAPHHPVSGITIALAIMYDVSTHAASSTPAERLPRICSSATLAIVVSSTSMIVASITAAAISHLLTAAAPRSGGAALWEGAAAIAAQVRPVSVARLRQLVRIDFPRVPRPRVRMGFGSSH